MLPTFTTDATAAEVAATAARLGGLPVRERPPRPGPRLVARVLFAVLVLLVVLVVLGIVYLTV